jgi:hypothetical protein
MLQLGGKLIPVLETVLDFGKSPQSSLIALLILFCSECMILFMKFQKVANKEQDSRA